MAHSLELQLEELYASLESPPGPNRCGSCRLCCTAPGLSRQNVTDLELSLLEMRYGQASAERFAVYARRQRDESGAFVYEVCPNWAEDGCQVYSHRPFSCRVFGHFRPAQTRLPDGCVYEGKDREFPAAEYYRVVPGARRLRQLSRDFQLRRATAIPGPSPASQAGVGLDFEDCWDEALDQIGRGELPTLPAESADEPLFASYIRALVEGEAGQHAEALRHYRRVLQACPQRSDLMTFAGLHAFQLGQIPEAEELWLGSLHLNPRNPMTHSFLGYLYFHGREWQLAADFFGAAMELEPDQPIHRQRREDALRRVK